MMAPLKILQDVFILQENAQQTTANHFGENARNEFGRVTIRKSLTLYI
jgi:hypothetical protein